MGYMQHHAIIVTAYNDRIYPLHVKAIDIFGDAVTEILPSAINGYRSFFVGPDGSKEGWPESDAGNARRQEFNEWLKENNQSHDAAEVQYHDEGNDLWVKSLPYGYSNP